MVDEIEPGTAWLQQGGGGLVQLSQREVQEATAVAAASGTPEAVKRRIAVILCAAEPAMTFGDVAERSGQSAKTVRVIVRRYREQGLAGLYRPGRKVMAATTALDAEISTIMHTPPPLGGRWSLRTLAAVLGHPKSTVARHCVALGVDLNPARRTKLAPLPTYDCIIGFMNDPPVYAIALQLSTGASRSQAAVPIAAVVAALDVAVVARTLDLPRHRTHETLRAFVTAIRTDTERLPASVFVAGYRASHGRDVVRDAQNTTGGALVTVRAVSFDSGMRNLARIVGSMGHRADGRCPERFGKLLINRIRAAGEAARERGVCVFWVHKSKQSAGGASL
jgi:transposase